VFLLWTRVPMREQTNQCEALRGPAFVGGRLYRCIQPAMRILSPSNARTRPPPDCCPLVCVASQLWLTRLHCPPLAGHRAGAVSWPLPLPWQAAGSVPKQAVIPAGITLQYNANQPVIVRRALPACAAHRYSTFAAKRHSPSRAQKRTLSAWPTPPLPLPNGSFKPIYRPGAPQHSVQQTVWPGQAKLQTDSFSHCLVKGRKGT
jgi:hypothetical protein